MKSKKIIIGVSACIVIAVLIAAAVKNKPKTEDTIGGDKEGMRVEVEYVKRDSIDTKISSSGKLEAIDTETVYLDVSNKIVTVHKEVGDTVEKGEVILTLDKEAQITNQNQLDTLQTQLAAAQKVLSDLSSQGSKGDILTTKSNIENLKNTKKQTQNTISETKVKIDNLLDDKKEAEENLAVNQKLLVEGLISQKEVDAIKDSITALEQQISTAESSIKLNEGTLETLDLQIETAQYNLNVLLNKESDRNKEQAILAKQTEIKQLETQISESQMSLSKKTTQIVAPISGVITALPVEEGMSVAGGTAVATIIDPSKLQVQCDISPYYAPDLKVGLDAIVKYTGSKTVEVAGEVTKVASVATVETTANGESTYIPVDVEISEPGDILKPGFSVDVKVITDSRENVCVVPLLAVMEEEENEYYVYVVKEDGSLEKRAVTEGLNTGLYIEVEGVEEGELIVNNPSDTLTEDTKVSYEKMGDM